MLKERDEERDEDQDERKAAGIGQNMSTKVWQMGNRAERAKHQPVAEFQQQKSPFTKQDSGRMLRHHRGNMKHGGLILRTP